MHPEGYEQVWAELPTILFIPLTRGKFTVIDQYDYLRVAAFSWYAMPVSSGGFYAVGRVLGKDGPLTYMHRLIFGRPVTIVDHADREKLNNRRGNLRAATRSENGANSDRSNKHGFRGVAQVKNRFIARISKSGSHDYLGCFESPQQAAKAYDFAALQTYGEFAVLNFPDRRGEYLEELAKHDPTKMFESSATQ